MTFLLAIISHLGWAIGDVFVVIAARRMGTYAIALWSIVLAFVLYSFGLPFFIHDFSKLTPILTGIILLLSVILMAGHAAFYKALRVGNASLVCVISASFAAVSVLLSLIFLGERLSLLQGAFIAIIFLGVFLCLISKEFRFKWGEGELFALIPMVCWGVYYACIKPIVALVGWYVPMYLFLALFPLIALFSLSKKVNFKVRFDFRLALVFVLSVVLTGVAEASYNIAIGLGDVSFVIPIAGSYPALFVVLSSFIFKEKMQIHQWIGLALSLIGICALSFT